MNWAYIAGYFDGEGHVSFHKVSRNDWEYAVGLSWYNTHLASLEAMQKFMGCGNIGGGGGTNKDVYVLSIKRRSDILRFGKKMLPYLIVKKDIATKMLDWTSANKKDQHRNCGFSSAANPEELRSLYIDQKQSTVAIAKKFGVAAALIVRLLKRHGIETRKSREQLKGIPKSVETIRRMKASRRKMWRNQEFRASQLATLEAGRRLAREAA